MPVSRDVPTHGVRTHDVLIAGGGPVGLLTGLLLSRAGLDVRVLEAEGGIARDLRASTFHPPTLDMLAPLGITAELLARGLVCPHWQIRMHPGGERAVFDMSVLADETGHPFRLQCEQWKLSEALLARLPEGVVRFAAGVSGFTQDETGVTATLDTGERLAARYLVGADGARSAVRRLLEAAFDGQTYPETTVLATTTFPFEDHLEGLSNVSYCWKDGGNFSLLKVPGRWRVSIYPREDVAIDAQTTPEAVDAALQTIVPRAAPYEIGETRAYRVHQRIVATYVHGRVLLAGDAAHLNSPAGGMGLNGGIHDAFELAEALADVLKHGADPAARLGLYDARRRPIAKEQILAQADRNRARMREKDPARRREILSELQAITADRTRLKAYLMRSSMIEGLKLARAIG